MSVEEVVRSCKRLAEARRIAAMVESQGKQTTYMRNLLVDMYGRCGSIEEARKEFDSIPPTQRNSYSYNLLLKAYIVNHHLNKAEVLFFKEIPWRPEALAATTLIGAYATLPDSSNMKSAKAAFDFALRDSVSWNALLYGYSKHRMLPQTSECYEKMPLHCAASWTSLFAAYAMKGHMEYGMSIFRNMPSRDAVAWENIVVACTKNYNVELAKAVFSRSPKHTLVSANLLLAANARAGQLNDAKSIFDSMAYRDGISWSNMLGAFAQSGKAGEAVYWYHQMQMEGILPDEVTFLWMFVSFSNLGDVRGGREIFRSMLGDYYLHPSMDHCVSMSVILGRAGHLQEAEDLIDQMPFWPDTVAWQSLLVACKHHKDVERAERASREALLIGEPSITRESLTCVVLCNSYRDCAELEELSRSNASKP